jgi:hypothetical protein
MDKIAPSSGRNRILLPWLTLDTRIAAIRLGRRNSREIIPLYRLSKKNFATKCFYIKIICNLEAILDILFFYENNLFKYLRDVAAICGGIALIHSSWPMV